MGHLLSRVTVALAMCLAFAVFWSSGALAGDAPPVPDTLVQRIAACTGCHGEHGEGGNNGFNPRLAGKPAGYLLRQMQDFQNGLRHYPIMEYTVAPLSDAYMAEIAAYFSTQQVPYTKQPAPAMSAKATARGEQLVTHGDAARGVPACMACHGPNLTGVQPDIPGLVNLPYDYISAQLGSWRTNTRNTTAPDCMATIVSRLSDADISAVSAWLATRPVPSDAHAEAPGSVTPPLPCGVLGAGQAEQAGKLSQVSQPGHVSQPGQAAAGMRDDARVPRGHYLAAVGDCASCHTARHGAAYAGGRIVPTPFGAIPAPNLTPDKETGLGTWSADDFYAAMHTGKARDGSSLYPAFPFTSYTKLTRADSDDLFAYLQSLPPVKRTATAPTLRWPYSMRSLMASWRWLYFDEGEFAPDPAKPAAWNRGAYLVQGLGHCNECHAPRNSFGAMVTEPFLQGGIVPVQNWYAPDLSMGSHGGLAGWSKDDVVSLLKTGHSAKGTAAGPMAEVVLNSTQYLNDADVTAMAVYLASLPAREPATERESAADAPDLARLGKTIYAKECAGCHGDDGRGRGTAYPPLDGNVSVVEPTGINAIRMLLSGGFPPATAGHPRPYSMPPFGQKLTDDEAAAVVTYIRQAWSNKAASVSASDVRAYRSVPGG